MNPKDINEEKNINIISEAEVQQDISEIQKDDKTESKTDDKTYEEVLEKLNIEEKDIQNSSEKLDGKTELQNLVKPEIDKIINLMKMGIINPLQGQNLMNHVVEKAYESMVQNGFNGSSSENSMNKSQAFFEFNRENPDFFNEEGRNEVLNYLKTDALLFDKDELKQISKLIEAVEKTAVDRYLKKKAYEENLNKLNEAAKQKLQANAQNSKNSSKNLNVFTREQIGKMSGADFAKYERLIMEQLKKGLIR